MKRYWNVKGDLGLWMGFGALILSGFVVLAMNLFRTSQTKLIQRLANEENAFYAGEVAVTSTFLQAQSSSTPPSPGEAAFHLRD